MVGIVIATVAMALNHSNLSIPILLELNYIHMPTDATHTLAHITACTITARHIRLMPLDIAATQTRGGPHEMALHKADQNAAINFTHVKRIQNYTSTPLLFTERTGPQIIEIDPHTSIQRDA